MKTATAGKLGRKTKFGYGAASIADAVAYDFVATFFLFFLTDVAGISPAFAGTIILLGVVWDGISDPIIGMMSDCSKSKYGKKRPFLAASALPLGIAIALLFTAVDFDGIFKNLYFLITAIIFWTAYTTFNIPYYALGSCLSFDDSERVELSSIRQVFNYIGLFAATALPTLLIGFFVNEGVSDKNAWSITALILGAIITAVILITWRATRGYEHSGCEEETSSIGEMFRQAFGLFKLKSYMAVLMSQLFYYISYTFLTSSILYVTTYIMGTGETGASILFVFTTLAGIVFAALLSKVAVRFDKRTVYIASLVFSSSVMIFMGFLPDYNLTTGIIYVVLYGVGSAAYWTLIFNLLYDTIDLDEFLNGRRREGLMVSFGSFCVKLAAALAAQMSGLILQFSGYDALAEQQAEPALDAMKMLFTIIPGIFMLASALCIFLFPLTRSRLQSLKKALELKRSGKDYSVDNLEIFLKGGR